MGLCRGSPVDLDNHNNLVCVNERISYKIQEYDI